MGQGPDGGPDFFLGLVGQAPKAGALGQERETGELETVVGEIVPLQGRFPGWGGRGGIRSESTGGYGYQSDYND
jgi:hypothetical protein